MATDPPLSGNVGAPATDAAAWARRVIEGSALQEKLNPGPCPKPHANPGELPLDLSPSRPAPLRVTARAPKTPRPGALVREEARAQVLHTFAHHELQAAEIFCWAFLAFPETPRAFRQGLLAIAQDELRHTRQYIAQVERLGSFHGAFEVRDWFWQRFRSVRTPLQFVSLMGIGLEGANLDHAELWAERFRAVGDEEGARCQEQVGREEEPHVAFAVQWFERWAGPVTFERWRAQLPAPLTPTVLRGPALHTEARRRCGLDRTFQAELDAWDRPGSGS